MMMIKQTRIVTPVCAQTTKKDKFKTFRKDMFDSRRKGLKGITGKIDEIGKQETEQLKELFQKHKDFFQTLWNDEEESEEDTKPVEIIDITNDDEYFEDDV